MVADYGYVPDTTSAGDGEDVSSRELVTLLDFSRFDVPKPFVFSIGFCMKPMKSQTPIGAQ
jgi:hypothetical protein